MATPRQSRRLSERLASNAPNSPLGPKTPAAAATTTSGRATRSQVKAERPPSDNGVSGSTKSNSTIPTPTQYPSDDELSTAPSSAAPTPADFNKATTSRANGTNGTSTYPGFQSASSLLRVEIELPERSAINGVAGPSGNPSSSSAPLASDSAKALSRSKYSLAPNKKRRTFVQDTDEDDSDFYSGADAKLQNLVASDAMLAQKLQAEEDLRLSKAEDVKPTLRGGSGNGNGGASDFIVATPAKEERPSTVNSEYPDVEILSSRPVKRQRRNTAGASAATPETTASSSRDAPITIKDDADDDSSNLSSPPPDPNVYDSDDSFMSNGEAEAVMADRDLGTRRAYREYKNKKRVLSDRERLEEQHPVLRKMWKDLEKMAVLNAGRADQPQNISRNLKPFQLEGVAWMTAMEKTKWKGGLLGDEMGLGKTIQAVSLIMSDYPAKRPTLVLVPPVALMQWTSEIASYTDGCLKTFVYHGTNAKTKGMTKKDIRKYDVIMMSYNSLESMYRKQERGFTRKDGVYKEESIIHGTHFHRVILDEAHCIKTRSTMTAKACFALEADYRWCLSGTPLQNRIGEFFSLLRFLQIEPFSNYLCRDCNCSKMEWAVDDENYCTHCKHRGMRHLSVFNQELLNPIQRFGNFGPGKEAFKKLRLLTDRIMLRRLKKDHTNSMELPVKRIVVDRQFFSDVETDFANSIMTNSERKFTTYVENGVMLNNYANIFGLIMQMRQVADHPDLILKKNSEGSQNVMICCICDEPAEEAINSRCRHDFCRECARSYLEATEQPDCPRCHIPLAIDLEQPEIEQDEVQVKKSSIINRIRMANWTSSSKIELLVYNLYRLRSEKASHKSIIFSQFTTMLQLIEWRLRRAGITTVMLDGSMTPAQRQASIEYFKNNVDVECFLVSLKAGGVALNLTEASRVFIIDPWWNPAAEWQSADRCHRIGQTRPCVVTRLCIEDSVESRMVLLQEKKTRMINSTINSDDAAMESLTPEDLQFLFRGS
ncbi:DNA repair protein rad16 [Sporothrix stenoceras]|uniref:DNA repair protein rad16 n=1 Tax=Sporothrix stenoceras TaxID=5173 RepID=A0ABR3Z4K7_9PEZI